MYIHLEKTYMNDYGFFLIYFSYETHMIPHILTCMKFLFVVSCHCTNMIGCGKVYKLSTTRSKQDGYTPWNNYLSTAVLILWCYYWKIPL